MGTDLEGGVQRVVHCHRWDVAGVELSHQMWDAEQQEVPSHLPTM